MNPTRTPASLMLFAAIAAAAVTFTACASPEKQSAPPAAAPAAAAAAAPAPAVQAAPADPRRFDLKGVVIKIDKPGMSLLIDAEDIPGFMSAMTMPYPVKDAHLLDSLAPGNHITAKVVSSGPDMWLENIVVAPAPAASK